MNPSVRVAVVGVRGIGSSHARLLNEHGDFELVALCDLNPANMEATDVHCPRFTDMSAMLAEVQPEAVVISTPNDSHAHLTLLSLDAGVRGIYCEKPMAVHLSDAKAMVDACRARGATLLVNHQRRLGREMITLRRLIAEGAIGQVELVRICNAGDVLSDGTHAIDSVRYLLGDRKAEWVYGQVFRRQYASTDDGRGFEVQSGRRFGHPVEDAAMAVIGFEGKIRVELFCGELFPSGRWYQDYEVIGTGGRLWRPSDSQEPPLRRSAGDGWEAVPLDEGPENVMEESFSRFAECIRRGAMHPLDGMTHGYAAMEIVSAVYESARLQQRVDLPMPPGAFALERLLAEKEYRGEQQ